MIVFGEHATAPFDIGLHAIDVIGMTDEIRGQVMLGRIGVVHVAAAIEQDHVILVEVRLVAP